MPYEINRSAPFSQSDITVAREAATEMLNEAVEFVVVARDPDGKMSRAVYAKPHTMAWASVALIKDCDTE